MIATGFALILLAFFAPAVIVQKPGRKFTLLDTIFASMFFVGMIFVLVGAVRWMWVSLP